MATFILITKLLPLKSSNFSLDHDVESNGTNSLQSPVHRANEVNIGLLILFAFSFSPHQGKEN